MKATLFLLILCIFQIISCEGQDKLKIWVDSIHSSYGLKKSNFDHWKRIDFSKAISNDYRFKNDPIYYYSGISGSSFERIDFHLKVNKTDSSTLLYIVKGYKRVNNNVRPIEGFMRITDVFKTKMNFGDDYLSLIVFDCSLFEPGNKESDGFFYGIYTLVAFSKTSELKWFFGEAGDFREYSNVFVGNWRKYSSNEIKSTIFSFDPIGLNCELPLSDEFYQHLKNPEDPPSYVIPKEIYLKNGWSDYSSKEKEKWWND